MLVPATLLLSRTDVARFLDIGACIDAIGDAFRAYADGSAAPPGILATHVDGGGFHVKTAVLTLDRPYYAMKVNANFPGNPARTGRPTIQGVVALFDAEDGAPLALLDSMELTSRRTAAASALAARHLAEPDANSLVICGCGEQGRWHARAINRVRTLERIVAYDADATRAQQFALDMREELGIEVRAVTELGTATRDAAMWATCTPARSAFLTRPHVRDGAFVAAVGADSDHKQEIDPALLATSDVVVDVMEQCATIGDLHHAIAAGVMTRDDVAAELGEVVAGRKAGRRSVQSIVIFDSTGTALQDVAAAVVVYREALKAGHDRTIALGQ